jgi:hypothetical protein
VIAFAEPDTATALKAADADAEFFLYSDKLP